MCHVTTYIVIDKTHLFISQPNNVFNHIAQSLVVSMQCCHSQCKWKQKPCMLTVKHEKENFINRTSTQCNIATSPQGLSIPSFLHAFWAAHSDPCCASSYCRVIIHKRSMQLCMQNPNCSCFEWLSKMHVSQVPKRKPIDRCMDKCVLSLGRTCVNNKLPEGKRAPQVKCLTAIWRLTQYLL